MKNALEKNSYYFLMLKNIKLESSKSKADSEV